MRFGGAAWWFLAPALAVYALFVIVPIADSFRLSLFHWRDAASQPKFVGLANFAALAHDPVFWSALWHNALLLALSLLIQLPLALLLAVLLSYPIRARALFRTVFFAPMVMPSVAIAVLWYGLLDQVIRIFSKGFGGNWLGSPDTAMLCVFVAICWRYVGFYMVLFMAGIAAIPEELYDAARIDGASEWQAFRGITLPMLRPMIGVAAVLSITGSLKYFDLVYMMAGGAPENSRELLATYVYRLAFDSGQGRFGYGSAVAVALFSIALAVALLVIRPWRKKEVASAG
jgi:raffinose/stachyose/melibiose transport system permease protein